MTHIMLDSETWGTRPGSILRSIGACVFDPKTGEIGDKFYVNVDRMSCEDAGLTTDPDTVIWWSKQSIEAQRQLLKNPVPLQHALEQFNSFWRRNKGEFIWSHGANFDIVLLEVAMVAVYLKAPWAFWNTRCCRTVLALGNRKPDRTGGIPHYALDDAVAQAKAVAATLRGGIKL